MTSSNRLLTKAAVAIATLAAPLALVGPAQAAPATHDFLPEEYNDTVSLGAGEMPCVPWAGTFHEVRSGGYKMVTINSGQRAGEVHLNGTIDGLVELTPADKNAHPTYTGTYREKADVILYEMDDQIRVGQYRLRTRLAGSDGSSLQLIITGKITTNGHGEIVVNRSTFSCQ